MKNWIVILLVAGLGSVWAVEKMADLARRRGEASSAEARPKTRSSSSAIFISAFPRWRDQPAEQVSVKAGNQR
jgi:hypothetical protein